MRPGRYDFEIKQGATVNIPIEVRNETTGTLVDLTGYTARMPIRKRDSSKTLVILLTTENGGLILGGEAGTITLSMSATTTALMNFTVAIYDLELIIGEIVDPLLSGIVTLVEEVPHE